MSRPTQTENNYQHSHKSVIDFVGAPMPLNPGMYPTDEMYMQSNYPPVGPGVYAMAGYPAYPGQQPVSYMQAPYPPPPTPTPQGYTGAFNGTPYYPYPISTAVNAPPTNHRNIEVQPLITEDTLQQKVDAKIEAIMNSHKTEMLTQQISRLTNTVQRLSKNIEFNQSDRPGLSSVSTPSSCHENEMSRRLRKLAAESGRAASHDTTHAPFF
jgi:hypothetical protein